MLAAYAARGLRVTGLQMQVLDASLRSWTPGRITLEVTDRVNRGPRRERQRSGSPCPGTARRRG